jgi:hypothetical protein
MMRRLIYNTGFRRFFYSLPLQLFFLHLKHNLLLLLIWAFLFGFITSNLGYKYGFPNLFLFPEYLGHVGLASYMIIGFSCGGFIMAFHIATYILHGCRFPFIATISRPFFKFSWNNFIIPLIFILTYIGCTIYFLKTKEMLPWAEIAINIFGFIIGNGFFMLIAFTYFLSTNKDLFKLFGIGTEEDYFSRKSKFKPVVDVFHRNEKWYKKNNKDDEWYIETYVSFPFRVQLCRDCSHYDREMLDSVFQQNHLNAAFFEIMVIATLLLLGLFREIDAFLIPAGATVFLFFTMVIMLVSALYSWLKSWTTLVFIIFILTFNFLSGQKLFNYQNQVYGLDYTVPKVDYSNESLHKHAYDTIQNHQDYQETVAILDRWKVKAQQANGGHKPKLVIFSCSGGGSKAALWSLYTYQYVDSILEGKLFNHTQLITGSSGGLMGASYLREIYLRSLTDDAINPHSPAWREKIAADLLNPVAFSMAVNDMFFRLQKFEDGSYTYTKDRGYAFERQLNKNTDNFLDKRLIDYVEPEKQALIPMMIFTPTIINEGRRLIISAQPVSYLVNNLPEVNVNNKPIPEAIEYTRFFKNHNPYNTRFTSALRMNATFPYVMPVSSLPSYPPIEIMDGGIRDNYGMKSAINYIFAMRKWIAENTSGVIIFQTRDKFKEWPVEQKAHSTTIQSLVTPVGSIYENFDRIQNFNNDEMLKNVSSWLPVKIDVVDFQLNDKDEHISLSFHLTTKEKKAILQSINLQENQESVKRLVQLLNEQENPVSPFSIVKMEIK